MTTNKQEWFSIKEIEGQCSKNEIKWLSNKKSLTGQMQNIGKVVIEIIEEKWVEEKKVWNRKVLMLLNKNPWLYAITTIPEAVIKELPFDVEDIGNKPIGMFLFNNENIKLENILVTRIDLQQETFDQIRDKIKGNTTTWGRKRVFKAYSSSIEINEFFLKKEDIKN